MLDAPDEAELAAEAGVERALVRVTLGVDADTHEAIRTGHHGSKFGLPPEEARALVADALDRGLDVLGVHVHVGSQLQDFDAQAETIVRLAAFAASCRDELGWCSAWPTSAAASGSATTRPTRVPDAAELAHERRSDGADRVRRGGAAATRALAGARPLPRRPRGRHALPRRERQAAPGPDVGRDGRRHVGQPTAAALRRPLHGALGEPGGRAGHEVVSVAGMHCESGDVLIDDVALPSPRRGDLLAVPATGAYTLAMASNYNGVGRPAAVLVADGAARVIRRRKTVDDLLRQRWRDGRATGRGRARPGLPRRGRRAADRRRRPRRRRRTARWPARPPRRQARAGRRGHARDGAPRGRGGGGARAGDGRGRRRAPPFETQRTGWRVHPFLGRIPADTTWRLQEAEIVGILTPSARGLADPEGRARLPFTSLRFPEPLYVDGIDVDGHVLWGMTLRLLDDLLPRLLAGEWDV